MKNNKKIKIGQQALIDGELTKVIHLVGTTRFVLMNDWGYEFDCHVSQIEEVYQGSIVLS